MLTCDSGVGASWPGESSGEMAAVLRDDHHEKTPSVRLEMMCVSAFSLLAAAPPPNSLLEISAAAILVKSATYADHCLKFSYVTHTKCAMQCTPMCQYQNLSVHNWCTYMCFESL